MSVSTKTDWYEFPNGRKHNNTSIQLKYIVSVNTTIIRFKKENFQGLLGIKYSQENAVKTFASSMWKNTFKKMDEIRIYFISIEVIS